ncbi:Pvc16 family protein [Robbsia sp. KACC 23696]|uniref:Pvc16 family protein n=1 Tax=Robbsia sp. KACC 23696 TaxID=3149231 RepID=UPI00325ADBBD
MAIETADPLLGLSSKLLSRVSYLLAERLTTRIDDQLQPEKRGASTVRALGDVSPGIKYTFEIPSDQAKGKATLISLFLYDVHEDNALRHSAMPQWRAQNPASAGKRPIRLCYLITCWFGGKDDDRSSEEDERYAMRISDALLSALISLRGEPLIPGAYCRLLPPSEKLFSLGQFWQALDDSRPRLTLGLTITVPYAPPKRANDAEPPIKIAENNTMLHLRPVANGKLSALDDDAERIVRLLQVVARAPQGVGARANLRDAELQLMDALSKEAKRWRDPKVQAGLLSLLSIPMEATSAFAELAAQLSARAASIQWRSGSDKAGALPADQAIGLALTRRQRGSGVSVADAVVALDRLAEKKWLLWQQGQPPVGNGKRPMSINDMLALAGMFGCVALAYRLKQPILDLDSRTGAQEERQ